MKPNDGTSHCSLTSVGPVQRSSVVIGILATLTGIREPLLPPLAASLLATAGTVALLKEAKNPSSEYSEELKTFSQLVDYLHSFSQEIFLGEEVYVSISIRRRRRWDSPFCPPASRPLPE